MELDVKKFLENVSICPYCQTCAETARMLLEIEKEKKPDKTEENL